jgi:hypothetical protein
MANNRTYAQAGSQFPNLIGNPLSLVAPNNTQDPNNNCGQTSIHTIANWFNKCAYEDPGPATFGTVRRNSLYGPSYSNLNLSFGKTFSAFEKYRLEIRADAQNALNHPSFGGPDSAIDDTHAATITSLTDGGRHIQLYARFSF